MAAACTLRGEVKNQETVVYFIKFSGPAGIN